MKSSFTLLSVWFFVMGSVKTEGHSQEVKRVERAVVDQDRIFFWHYEKLAIIRKTNEKRRLPGASNMQIMYWDYTLENIAKNYAKKCIYMHNDDRKKNQDKFSTVGENLFYTTATSWITDVFINAWYDDEVNDYLYENVTCAEGKFCGHYTQMVWATSHAVGCGYSYCESAQGPTKVHNNIYLVVCNYGPAGNWYQTLPYKKGTECTECPADKTTCDDGLCSAANCGGKTCQNSGTLVDDVCMCDCRGTGYEGDFCEIVPTPDTTTSTSTSTENATPATRSVTSSSAPGGNDATATTSAPDGSGCSLKTFNLFLISVVCFVSMYFALG